MDEDIFGQALLNYQNGNSNYKLWIHNRYGNKEEMPVSTYFRTEDDMSDIDLLAIEGCTGKVLDIGAGAGSHSLILQQKKLNVTALDISAGAITVMQERGVKKIINADIFNYNKQQFNTLLLLMNGIGLAGTLHGLKMLLQNFHQLLKPGGHVLFDSSDVAYIYKGKKKPKHYYGEIEYQYAYGRQRSDWFKWLYVDQQTMERVAKECDFKMEVLAENEYDHYLGKLTKA